MPNFTPGPWRLGNDAYDAVVADVPTGREQSEASLTAYGGYLVAESVFFAPNRKLIVTASEMFVMLIRCKLLFENIGLIAYATEIEALLAKIE
jgi:hypothetical protein